LATYQQNFPNATVLCKDIREVTGEEVRAHIHAKYANWDGEIHTVFGGPPCQGFSVAGLQNVEDERNGLVFEFVRLVLELNPLTAIMENVPGIESQKFGCITANLQAVLEEHYFISKWNLNASNYGVPQARKRVFFVASKYGEIMPPQHQPQHTVRDAIADLLPIPLIPKQNTQEFCNNWSKGEYAKHLEKIFPWIGTATNQITGFAATTHTVEVIKQFINTPPGAREAKSRSKKLEWDGFCVTLRAGSGNRTPLRPLHPSEPRVISVREAARLHSYPDWFNFSEGILHAQREIGNSVPPLLAYAVGMQVREHLPCNIKGIFPQSGEFFRMYSLQTSCGRCWRDCGRQLTVTITFGSEMVAWGLSVMAPPTSVAVLLGSQHAATKANIKLLSQADNADYTYIDEHFQPESLQTSGKRACVINAQMTRYRESMLQRLV
jgi:DNA (cytosine-5)-methyltransferase 1